MGTEKTPLVQKLILAVLTLILLCLVVLIAQNRSREKPEVTSLDAAAEPAPPPEPEHPQPTGKESAPPPPRSAPPVQPVRQSAGIPAVAESAPGTAIAQLQATPPPQPYTTLVSPAGRNPVEIVVRPEGGILKTELCGRVRLEGKPPPEVPIRLDGTCRRLHEQPLTTRHYVVGPNGGLANVLVYIKEGLPSNYSQPPVSTNPLIRAEACLFEPYVSGVQAGQQFVVRNVDSILHNFHAVAKNNREFNVSLPLQSSTFGKSFANPEVFVRFKCDVHPWEFAYMGVVPHPFFSVTDSNGVFCLPPGLPHGRYVLAAAHPKAGETLQQIVVQEDNLNLIELAFTVPR